MHRSWAPRGADRFYNLVKAHFFDGTEFFRVVKGFVVQFGISGYPSVSTAWQNANLKDDPVKASNTVGTITFADGGPNTRTTQVFINLANNAGNLDGQGFAPFGKVTTGMKVVNKLYGGYDDTPTNDQPQIASQGNAFLKKTLPEARFGASGQHRPGTLRTCTRRSSPRTSDTSTTPNVFRRRWRGVSGNGACRAAAYGSG